MPESYTKPYKTPSDLVEYVKTKGLYVANDQQAMQFLTNINYYRFKIYLYPFFKTGDFSDKNKAYKQGATFEQGIELYRFDEELRALLFPIIARIEIKLRTRLDQVITEYTDNPFWYLDDTYFMANKMGSIKKFREDMIKNMQRSKSDFSLHFRQNYQNSLPPFWILAELITFGNIRVFYQSLNKEKFKSIENGNLLDFLAKEFGATNIAELNNWITLIRDVRNRCAHHSRVWNSNYPSPKRISTLLNVKPKNSRLYLFVALLHVMNTQLRLNLDIKEQVLALFEKYPAAMNFSSSAGFPENWNFDTFWEE